MSIDTLSAPASVDDFTPLSEHESQTPASFFDGKPVLHAFRSGCHVLGPDSVLSSTNGPFRGFQPLIARARADFDEAEEARWPSPWWETWHARNVDIFVTSECVSLQETPCHVSKRNGEVVD